MKKKIVEEALEIQHTHNREEIIKETADLIEILECLMSIYGITWNEITSKQTEKNQERGAFHKKLLLIETYEG